MNYTITIVDDDHNDLNQTKIELKQLATQINCSFTIHTFHNSDFVEYKDFYSDLYILDIDMPNLNGFQLSRKISSNQPNAQICFCSSHEDLVFQSFQLPSFYFVRKKHLNQDLHLALNKFILSYKPNKNYILNHSGIIKKISYNNIVYFEVVGNDLFIHTNDKQTYRDRKSFRKLKDNLDESQFIHISKNFTINFEYINSIEQSTVFMHDGLSFSISQKSAKRIKDSYLKYLLR